MSLKEPRSTGTTRKGTEILVVTRNELGALARVTTPLAKNNINIECFTGYEWGGEAAFRMVTDNNKKACDVLKKDGYNVQETTVVFWQVENTPGRLRAASTALAESQINTFCAYATTQTNSNTQLVVLNTSDPNRTIDVLGRLR